MQRLQIPQILIEHLDKQVFFRAIDVAAKLFAYASTADKYYYLINICEIENAHEK
jgi:hypothetical protein